MRFRTTWILLVVLVALAAFVLFWERKQLAPDGAEATPWPTTMAPIGAFSAADARAVTITRNTTAQMLELALREDGRWYLTAPVEDLARQDSVNYLVQSFANLTPSRALAGAAQATDYGLQPGQLRVEIELEGSQRVFVFGAQTPTSTGYYVQVEGDATIYIVSYSVYDQAVTLLNDPPVAPTPTLPETLPSTTLSN